MKMEKGYFEWKFTLNYTHEKFRHVVPTKFDICVFVDKYNSWSKHTYITSIPSCLTNTTKEIKITIKIDDNFVNK